MVTIARWINDGGRDEDHEVSLAAGTGLAAEQAADERKISQHGNFIFYFGDVFSNEAAQHDGLAIPDNNAGGYLANAKVGQGQDTCGAGGTSAATGDGHTRRHE